MIDIAKLADDCNARDDERASNAHQDAMARGARCTECPLYMKRRGPVPGDVRKNSKLTIIGEAPGNREVEEGRVFTGKSGVELDKGLTQGGLNRQECTIVNVLECQPDIEGGNMADYLTWIAHENERRKEKGLPPIESPIDCCRPRLIHDIREANADVWLPVGGRALEASAKMHGLNYGKGKDEVGEVTVATIMNQHGSPIILSEKHINKSPIPNKKKRILCPTLHPAFAMRGKRAYKPVVINDIARGAEIANRGHVDWEMPQHTYIYPRIDEIIQICARFKLHETQVSVDIETDSVNIRTCRVRCVGLGGVIDGEEFILVVPFRWMDGRDYWASREDKMRAIEAVRMVTDNCPLVMHNGAFDTNVMLRVGLMTQKDKLWDDTMIGHHDTDHNDLPHTLGFVATRFLEVPMWKKDVDHKATDNVARDRDLHEYNAMDIAATMRTWPHIQERIYACATQEQYRTDQTLAPIARDMERLGLFVNEYERGKLSKKLNKVTFTLRNKFVNAVGRDLNPKSPQQVAKWLFIENDITPPLNPQGYEWQEGDTASTGAPAITKILARDGIPQNVRQALEVLLEFKSAERLRSGYIDNLPVSKDKAMSHLPKAPAVECDVFNKKQQIERQVVLQERWGLSRLHPTWKIHVVPTGRWSSSPNAQNWPSRAWGNLNLRTLIVAPPGHVIVGADYSQVELRIYAVQAQDRLLLEAFQKGMDPHALNAAVLFCDSTDEGEVMKLYKQIVTWKKSKDEKQQSRAKYMRTVAKRFVFLEAYGGEEDKLFSVMSSERDKATGKLIFPRLKPQEVEEWHERWHTLHPETKTWQHRCQRMQREHGWVAASLDYRRRFFPGGPDKKNAVANHTIQGTAAAIMNRGIRNIHDAIPFGCWSEYTGLCLQVHDYAGVYVPYEKADLARKIIWDCMYYEAEGMTYPPDEPLASWDWAAQG